MSDNPQASKFVRKVKTALDDSVENLDAGVLSRLNQARRHALDSELPRRRAGLFSIRYAVAAATVVLVLLATTLMVLREPAGPGYYSDIEDVEILATGEAPDFYMDLDFYTWLAEEAENAG